jgi:hypothetical protein
MLAELEALGEGRSPAAAQHRFADPYSRFIDAVDTNGAQPDEQTTLAQLASLILFARLVDRRQE